MNHLTLLSTHRACFINYLLSNYCELWPWSRKKSNASRVDWVGLEWIGLGWSGLEWSDLWLGAFSFLSSWEIFVGVSNQLSDIPYEARQTATPLHIGFRFRFRFRFGLGLVLVLVFGLVSVSEMLRLISCHKPNDKTYFCRFSKCARASVLLLLPICVYLWQGQQKIKNKKNREINFKFDYNKNKARLLSSFWFTRLKVCPSFFCFIHVGVPRKTRPHPEMPRKFEINL